MNYAPGSIVELLTRNIRSAEFTAQIVERALKLDAARNGSERRDGDVERIVADIGDLSRFETVGQHVAATDRAMRGE